jgi:Tfp pilus assembly protein PilV
MKGTEAVAIKKSAGLSLAEVVITITLLGFIMMVMFNIFPGSMGAVRHAEHQMIASELAQSILEGKISGPFKKLPDPPLMDPIHGPDGTKYTPKNYSAITETGYDANYIKKLTIMVSWEEKDREYTMVRVIYVSSIQK